MILEIDPVRYALLNVPGLPGLSSYQGQSSAYYGPERHTKGVRGGPRNLCDPRRVDGLTDTEYRVRRSEARTRQRAEAKTRAARKRFREAAQKRAVEKGGGA
jgi:hypothetical protein